MIICSCGHEVPDFDHLFTVTARSVDRMGEKALSYMTVCGACEDGYRQRGAIFDNNDDGFRWLGEKQW